MPATSRTAIAVGAALLLILLASSAAGQPLPPTGLRVTEVGEFSVNVTFTPSPSTEVGSYNVYASDVNGTSVGQLRPPIGLSSPYDRVFVTAPGNLSTIGPAVVDPRFWFQNASATSWILGFEDPSTFRKYVPSDATAIAYRLTGLAANATVYIAVTAVDQEGTENPSIAPVHAVPLAQPVPEKPRNEGIFLSWSLILVFVFVAILLLARHEGRKNRIAYVYILPPLLGLAALTFYPVLFGIFISFTDRIGSQTPSFHFTRLTNYVRVFSQPDFTMVLTTTLVWTVVKALFHLWIGLFLSVPPHPPPAPPVGRPVVHHIPRQARDVRDPPRARQRPPRTVRVGPSGMRRRPVPVAHRDELAPAPDRGHHDEHLARLSLHDDGVLRRPPRHFTGAL